jgi:transposase
VLGVETIEKIRRDYFVDGKNIKAVARQQGLSRNTVRKVLRSGETALRYERSAQPRPQLEADRERLGALLEENETKGRRERLTLIRLFETLQAEGFAGSYHTVRRYARGW